LKTKILPLQMGFRGLIV